MCDDETMMSSNDDSIIDNIIIGFLIVWYSIPNDDDIPMTIIVCVY